MKRPVREPERDYLTGWETPRKAAPLAVRATSGLQRVIADIPVAVRRTARSAAAEAAAVILVAAALAVVHHIALHHLIPPAPPSSEQVCGSSVLNGPSSPPGGAVTIPAGDNSALSWSATNTTFWFAPGTHTLGTGEFDQIDPGANDTLIGAPGAILDGQGLNDFAVAGTNTGITVEYLTVQNFTPPGSGGALNQNSLQNWTIQYDTLQDNIPGAGAMLGTNSVFQFNCGTNNGQYAFNAFSSVAGGHGINAITDGPSNITVDDNEISYNNLCNWGDFPNFPIVQPAGCAGAGQFDGCGCSGGGKFWRTYGSQFENNYVHDNYNVGVWWDTDNTGATITGNYLSGNLSTAIDYELSYNALISNNILIRNTIPDGQSGALGSFPVPTIYVSESGSDSRVSGSPYGTSFQITGNQLYDNFGGVVLWENADRFCGTLSPTHDQACTMVNAMWNSASYTSSDPCSQSANISITPYIDDCRWKTQNVSVSGNLFDLDASDPAFGGFCTQDNRCGFNGVFSQFGITSPYTGTFVENNITFNQDNLFSGNTYCGAWSFDALNQGNIYSFATWQGAPYGQDPGSTLNNPSACTPAQPQAPPVVNRPVVVPIRAGRR